MFIWENLLQIYLLGEIILLSVGTGCQRQKFQQSGLEQCNTVNLEYLSYPTSESTQHLENKLVLCTSTEL